MNVRRRILRAARPLTRLLDRVNLRIGRATLQGDLYHAALTHARPGDIVLTRTAWRPSNLLLPGRWTHVLLVVDRDVLVEATLPRVKTTWLVDVWANASEVLIMRPKFLTAEQQADAAACARGLVGTPYDLEFQLGPRELYCSELVYNAMLVAGGYCVPDLRTREFGVLSIRPDAFADRRYFQRIIQGGT